MAHHVFISYSSKNKQLADALCHTLEQHRISCWIAPRDVLPGEPYAREIIRGIRDCEIIVLIYTNDSNASEHVLNEIDKAFNYGKVIIPFIADDTRMSDEFDYYLSRKHWLTAYPNPEQHFSKLVDSISRTLKLDATSGSTASASSPTPTAVGAQTPSPVIPHPSAAPVNIPRPQAGRSRKRDIQKYDNGDRYEGEIYENKRDGQGTYTWKNGNKYTGDFIDNQRTGRGTFYWTDGDRYEGEFVEGKRTGKGIYYWKSGSRYEGEFVDGKMHGKGTYFYNDGNKYIGDWVEDARMIEYTCVCIPCAPLPVTSIP